ncbi:hypothetical protein YDYSY3_15770 [Paenibacillus chitinolyticus]|uniref:hypothetical protein n=1 Tax=Paenibacillus chitinolyticus TaxID=79263 RepID=UPI0026E4B2A8|nr:hypothetical protein [Paenibacillus chitinolyticus]GKS10577.1 hypothetical protein YDYSY3_15770 [Paenibacillus chitinolyticus]
MEMSFPVFENIGCPKEAIILTGIANFACDARAAAEARRKVRREPEAVSINR